MEMMEMMKRKMGMSSPPMERWEMTQISTEMRMEASKLLMEKFLSVILPQTIDVISN